MCSKLEHINWLFNLSRLCHYSRNEPRRPFLVYGKPKFKLRVSITKEQSLLKGMIRIRNYYLGINKEHQFRLQEVVTNLAVGILSAHKPWDDDENIEHKEINSAILDSRDTQYSNGNGNGNSNYGGNGNGGDSVDHTGGQDHHDEDGPMGVEWWWWWKWQQARYISQTATSGSHSWPVDAAVQVMANEVIQPAVEAIVVEPFKQHTKQGIIWVVVLGAFAVSCLQLVAGLAVVSMGVSLAFAASIVLATLLFWPWQKSSTHNHEDNDHIDNGDK